MHIPSHRSNIRGLVALVVTGLFGCGHSSPGSSANPNDASVHDGEVTVEKDGGAHADARQSVKDGGHVVPPGPGSDGGADGAMGCVHGPFPSPDIYDEHCNFDQAAYVQIAQSLSTDEGISYRFGPSSTYYHPQPESFPMLPRVQVHICGDGPGSGPPPGNIYYQIGDDCSTTNPGNYSDDEGIVLFVPAVAALDAGQESSGVYNIGIQDFVYNSFYYRPGPVPDLEASGYADQLTSSTWTTANGGPVHAPVASGRGIAPTFGQTSQVAYIAFNDGLIGTIGCNTEPGGLVTNLPSGLVPTSVGVTNGNEFLLATLWDTNAIEGKLAVFSIESDHAGTGDFDDQYYDFHTHLPGFPNTGNATTLKLLGIIELPGMVAPTDIAVASSFQAAFFQNPVGGGNATPASIDLTQESVWETFTGTGDNSTQRSTSGFAIVTSRSERKVAFIDLQPLFDFFNATYFTTFAQFQATQSNWGPADDQWPYTFAYQPSETPNVVTTLSLSDIPTSVYAGRTGSRDATGIQGLVATMDGTLHIYSLGGLFDATPATASGIMEIGTAQVGHNPTNMTISKDGNGLPPPGDAGSNYAVEAHELFVTSRGDRTVNFVTVTGSSGTITQALQDSELVDPIQADNADNESFASFVLSVADYNGRQVVNYRYAPVALPDKPNNGTTTYPLPTLDGGTVIECGGSFSVQGKPFLVSGTNTT